MFIATSEASLPYLTIRLTVAVLLSSVALSNDCSLLFNSDGEIQASCYLVNLFLVSLHLEHYQGDLLGPLEENILFALFATIPCALRSSGLSFRSNDTIRSVFSVAKV